MGTLPVTTVYRREVPSVSESGASSWKSWHAPSGYHFMRKTMLQRLQGAHARLRFPSDRRREAWARNLLPAVSYNWCELAGQIMRPSRQVPPGLDDDARRAWAALLARGLPDSPPDDLARQFAQASRGAVSEADALVLCNLARRRRETGVRGRDLGAHRRAVAATIKLIERRHPRTPERDNLIEWLAGLVGVGEPAGHEPASASSASSSILTKR